MLNAIVLWSLRFRGVVLALALMLLVYGVFMLGGVKYDVFPEFAAAQVEIQTEAPGLAPEQVEALVTQRIENELNGLPGIEAMRSSSVQGLSVITLVFQTNRDIYLDRQAVTERLGGLSASLPQGMGPPMMSALTSSTGDLMSIGLTSDQLSLVQLRTLEDTVVKQRLLAVPGVARIGVFGGRVRQMQILLDPQRLRKNGVAIDDVITAAQKATGIRGAGFIDTSKQRLIVRTEGQALSPEQMAKVAMVVNGPDFTINTTLGDVAKVIDGEAPPISAALVNGHPGIVLNVWAQFGANTVETTRLVDTALGELKPDLEKQGVQLDPTLFRAANFIQTAVHNVRLSLLIGGVLVIVVLMLFLFEWRTAAISCSAIPLSLLTAIVVLNYRGYTLNTMTLGGLAIAIGEVVDDAVIGVENVLRRLRERQGQTRPDTLQVILDASLEVRSPVVYATFAVCLVFVPILTMSGLAGRLFAPLGMTYILAIMASLVVALTVTPAMCLTLLGHNQLRNEESPLARFVKSRYRTLLIQVEGRSRWVIIGVIVFMVVGFGTVPFLGGEFLPSFQEGHFIAHLTGHPGASLEESLQWGLQATKDLLGVSWVRSVAQRVGRAGQDDTFGPNESELEIDLKLPQGMTIDQASEGVRDILKKLPLASSEVNTFLTERIEETLSGYTSAVVLNVFGNDLDVIDAKAKDVLDVLKQVPGAEDVQLRSSAGVPQVTITLRPDALLKWGIEPVQALDLISTAYEGQQVGQIFQGNSVIGVSVLLDPRWRQDPRGIGDLPLRNAAGTYVPMKELATIQMTAGRSQVLHEGARRVQTITCNVTGRDQQSFETEARQKIAAAVTFPPGTYLVFGGASEAQAATQRDLLFHSALVFVGITVLLSMVMGHWKNLMLVLLNLPLALVGGVLVVLVTGRQISMGSLVGFVTLFGITLRNSIIMISHYEHLVTIEGMRWNVETAIQGASDRLVPILMTALVTALGLLPLALGRFAAGREIEGPMALVILGGLFTSTVLNLIVLPTLALRFGRFDKVNPG
jgi:CzcA family heavy metal efflux pump